MNETNLLVEFDSGRIGKYDRAKLLKSGWVQLSIRSAEGINLNRKVPRRRIHEIVSWHAEEPRPFEDPLYTATRLRHFADLAEAELDLDGEDEQLKGDSLAAMRQCAKELEKQAEREADE